MLVHHVQPNLTALDGRGDSSDIVVKGRRGGSDPLCWVVRKARHYQKGVDAPQTLANQTQASRWVWTLVDTALMCTLRLSPRDSADRTAQHMRCVASKRPGIMPQSGTYCVLYAW